MRNMKYLAFILALLLLLSACGNQIKTEDAEQTPPPVEDDSEMIPDSPPTPDGSKETDDGSQDDSEFNRITFDPRPGAVSQEVVQTYIAHLHEFSERVFTYNDSPTGYVFSDLKVAEKLMESDPISFPPSSIYGVVMDSDRTDAADVQMAVQIQRNMTNEDVWDRLGNPHFVFEVNYYFGRYDPEYLKAFYVLNNGQVLTVIYDRNTTRMPWLVTDAVIENIDVTIGTHYLMEFGNYMYPDEVPMDYEKLIKMAGESIRKIEIEGFDTVALYEWEGSIDDRILIERYYVVQTTNERGEDVSLVVHRTYKIVSMDKNT